LGFLRRDSPGVPLDAALADLRAGPWNAHFLLVYAENQHRGGAAGRALLGSGSHANVSIDGVAHITTFRSTWPDTSAAPRSKRRALGAQAVERARIRARLGGGSRPSARRALAPGSSRR